MNAPETLAKGRSSRRSLGEGGGAEVGLRLAGALGWFWFVRSHVDEGRRWLERALAATAGVLTPARVKALHGAGRLALEQGELDIARPCFSEGSALGRELADRRGQGGGARGAGAR